MVLEDELAVERLAITRDGVHAVQVDAGADHRERVAGEVEVGHRVDDEVGLGLAVHHGVERDGARQRKLDLELGQTGHGLLHELQVVLDGVQLLAHGGNEELALDASLLEILVEELVSGLGDRVEDLGHELLEVEHLDTLIAQGLSEGVVLLLGDLQERNVVEQQSLELVGGQIEQLLAGPVQADLLQRPDLGSDMQTFRHCLLPFFPGTPSGFHVQPLSFRKGLSFCRTVIVISDF